MTTVLRITSALLSTILCLPALAVAQANGTLQIHYMDVGQGDGAVLISPLGQVVVLTTASSTSVRSLLVTCRTRGDED